MGERRRRELWRRSLTSSRSGVLLKSSAATKSCCGIYRINSSPKTASYESSISTAPKCLPSASSASRPFARSSQIRSTVSGDRRAHRAHGAVLTVCIREGLRGAGYVEGQNLLFEFRSAAGDPAVLPKLAEELV